MGTDMLTVGVTGTSKGARKNQIAELKSFLLKHSCRQLHHGDCVGADAQAHDLAVELGLDIFIHPPENPSARAFCKGAKTVFPEKPYLVRNRCIVDSVSFMIALPKGAEVVRSGTWSTVRYARKIGRPCIILE